MRRTSHGRLRSALAELPVVLGLTTVVLTHGHGDTAADPTSAAQLARFAWTFAVIAWCAFRALHHADQIADHLGEPLGTVILTVAAITIEVAVVMAVMLGGHGGPAVARDTMFAVLMIVLNGLVGSALLVGGVRRGESTFNLESSAAYLALLIPLSTIGIVLPRFTMSRPDGFMSAPMEIFVAGACLCVYAAFLWLQTSRHQAFFRHELSPGDGLRHEHPAHPGGSVLWLHGALLVVALVIVVALAEGLGDRLGALTTALRLPAGLGGVVVALLILAPEGLAALVAAGRDDMQRTINILLGTAVSSIGLTIPAILLVSRLTGRDAELGLEVPQIVLLAGTLLLCMLNLTRGRVNVLQGLVHLTFFGTWIMLIFE